MDMLFNLIHLKYVCVCVCVFVSWVAYYSWPSPISSSTSGASSITLRSAAGSFVCGSRDAVGGADWDDPGLACLALIVTWHPMQDSVVWADSFLEDGALFWSSGCFLHLVKQFFFQKLNLSNAVLTSCAPFIIGFLDLESCLTSFSICCWKRSWFKLSEMYFLWKQQMLQKMKHRIVPARSAPGMQTLCSKLYAWLFPEK